MYSTDDIMKRMFSVIATILMLASLLPAALHAGFTGVIDMQLTMPNGTSAILYSFGRNAQRMDMTTKLDKIPDSLHTTVITRKSEPDLAVIVNHKAGTFKKVSLKTALETTTLVDFDDDYMIEKGKPATIQGYNCSHVTLSSTTDTIEMWLTEDIGDFETFRLLQSQNPRLSNTVLSEKLAEEGIDGFPVRIIQKNENGQLAMEVVSVNRKTVEPDRFSVPKMYSEVIDEQKPLNNRQKEHLKDLMEKIKDFRE